MNYSTSKIEFKNNIRQIFDDIPNDAILITDYNVEKIYSHYTNNFKKITIEPGEKSKTFENVQLIIKKLLEMNASKNIHLIALGGGVVCDITGFVASIYKRSVKHSFIPTTLLAQIDASIGGKNGINFEQIKNVVGTFKNPNKIYITNEFLKSLNEQEIINGIAELLKIAIIKDKKLFNNISRVIETEKFRENINLDIIKKAVALKLNIVSKDFLEKGSRKILNFGHTFGHSIEMINNISHGYAVLIGMKIALDLSEKLCGLDTTITHKLKNLLMRIPMPNLILNKEKIFEKIYNDKKADSDKIDLVLLKNLESPIIYSIKLKHLKEIYYDMP